VTKEEVKRILSENRAILNKYRVRSISLFGSYVRNEQREDSDIDFLVDFEEPTYDNLLNLVFALEKLFARNVEVIPEGGLSPYIEPLVKEEAEKIET
jgi:predicted nucleotidyltransferase